MRILYITPDLTNSGGIARVMALKANYFSSVFDYEVHILTPKSPGSTFFYDFDSEIHWHPIAYNENSLKFLWRYIHFVKKTISETKPDIIIICDALYWSFIPWILKSKTPMIFETHVSTSLRKLKYSGIFGALRFKFVQSIKQFAKRKFDKVIFKTHEGSKEWDLQNGIVIPNPLSFDREKQSDLKNKKALVVCRHSHEKGIDRLLLIWKRILENHPNWELDICGQWEDLRYQEMAANLQISANVNFIPPTNDIQKHYLESSVYLMASHSEAFGMVLIEAMACGLPCLAYNCPSGPMTIIKDGINGFLIEDGNLDSFVDKLNLIIEDENLRKKLGQNASESVKKYELQLVMNQWKALFDL